MIVFLRYVKLARPLSGRAFNIFTAVKAPMDPTQEQLLNERCILVDKDDTVTGSATKRECHLKENIIKFDHGMLHRAFSVFLFNNRGELLMQQRADTKITFPNYYTNTCCSHPLYNQRELSATDHIGVKLAAQRRLEYELGIPKSEVPLNELKFLTRIHYKAYSGNMWGEHELDYIFILQRDVHYKPNFNEVKDCRFMDQKGVAELLKKAEEGTNSVTPWFKLIAQTLLFKWWNNLDCLDLMEDPDTIHRM